MTTFHAVLALALALPAHAGQQGSALKGEVKVAVCNSDPIVLTLTATPIGYSGPSYYSSVTVSSGSGAGLGGAERRSTTKPRILPGDSVELSWTADRPAQLTLSSVGPVTGSNATVIPGGVGDHTYTLTATSDANGCHAEGSVSVTVTVQQTRVYLSGSRYSSAPTILDYILQPGAWCVDCFGAGINAFENFAGENYDARAAASARNRQYTGKAITSDTASKDEGFKEFADEIRSWPRSVQAFQNAHVGGNTYIVDERGRVLGSMPTLSIYDTGVPGLSYAGDPSGYGGRNRLWVGSGDFKWQGVDYEVVGLMSASPIILDLDGDEKPDVDRGEWLPHPNRFNRSRAVLFDITATGFPNFSEWIGPKDGLLIAAVKPGVTVIGGEKLFGNPVGYIDGYQKLGLLYDKNNDGEISGRELDGLAVWQDLNGNGRIDPGEVRSARELGITRISTKHYNLKSTFTINGEERSTWDWWPTSMVVYPKPVAKAPAREGGKL